MKISVKHGRVVTTLHIPPSVVFVVLYYIIYLWCMYKLNRHHRKTGLLMTTCEGQHDLLWFILKLVSNCFLTVTWSLMCEVALRVYSSTNLLQGDSVFFGGYVVLKNLILRWRTPVDSLSNFVGYVPLGGKAYVKAF